MSAQDSPAQQPPPHAGHASHAAAREKFDSPEMAAIYRAKFVGTSKDRREKRCILRGLAGVAKGALVLDLPCGTGRITTFLVDEGFKVVAADASQHMLEEARDACLRQQGGDEARLDDAVRFSHEDVMRIGFPDGAFDAVVSNRLFHHFTEPATRRRALSELARVSRGPVVVSFFCSFALSALKQRIANAARGVVPADRVPIPFRAFREDLEAAGLRADAVYPVRFGISPQTYVRAVRA